MNKSLGLITLCLGSAAVGGFIAVRLLAHPNAPAVATSLSSPTGATTVSTPRDITGKPDHPTLAAGAAPQVPTLMETRDDYDFESLAGPSQELARRLPLDRILVETDSPYLAPVPHRGQRNEPAFVSFVAAELARIHGLSPDEMAAVLLANSARLFGLRF